MQRPPRGRSRSCSDGSAARRGSAGSAPLAIPPDWTFRSLDVAGAFDAHVREQLPWYELTTGVVAHLGRHYIPQGGLVYDVGASTGNIGRALAATLSARSARLVAIEAAPEMAARYSGPGDLHVGDALAFDFQPFDFGACFLALMFFPVAARAAWLRDLVAKLRPGGALVVFDKCEPAPGYLGTVLARLALAGKVAAGADPAEVIAKELSLAGAQRPLRLSELPAGAAEVFRFGDFAGWVIEAP